MRAWIAFWALCLWLLPLSGPGAPAQGSPVSLIRVPNNGIQPMAKVDAGGTLHLTYFTGDPSGGDVFYVFHRAERNAWSVPIRVNSQPGSVMAATTVRAAHMALGADGRVHVAWVGLTAAARPRGPDGETPMLYARLNNSGDGFEPQRNVVQHAYGDVDGGTVVADGQGRVSVLWHAEAGPRGEEHRRVWMTTSTDGGKTFEPEIAISEPGVCGCCSMSAMMGPDGTVRALYRAFRLPDHRDMFLLTSDGSESDRHFIDPWRIGACPLSTSSVTATEAGAAIAWETGGDVAWASLDRETSVVSAPVRPPKPGGHRRHPAVALTSEGRILFAWTEGMALGRGGTLHWQEYDSQGQPTRVSGTTDGVPVWSRPAVTVDRDGRFTILY